MNILFIVPDFYPNSTGFANASLNLINAIKKYSEDKYKVWVFTTVLLNDQQEITSARVIRYKNACFDNRFTHWFHERRKYKYIDSLIQKEKIDIIFFETNTFAYVQYWLLKKYDKKVMVRLHSTADTEVMVWGKHGNINSKVEYWLVKKFMKEVRSVIATSGYYLDFCKKYYLNDNVYSVWNNKEYFILYNTAERIQYNGKRDKYQKNVFMTMGKMSENGLTQKGIIDLLKAVFFLKNSQELPKDFKLIVVGTGIKVAYIKKMIVELNLEQEVELIESVSHDKVIELISMAKAIVLLSRYEGQSMFITESLSLGKAVILTNDNGMEDMIIDNGNGFCVKKGDFKQAAYAIKRMIHLKPDELQKMEIKSREIFDKNYSEKAVYEQFDYIIQLR